MGLVGAGISAVGQFAGGSAARKAGRINQRIKDDQADHVMTQTAADVGAHRRGFDKFRGALRGDITAYGGSASSGTGLLLAQEAERQAKLDELNIITAGMNQANALRMGADMDAYEGRVIGFQKTMGGLGTALKGFGDWQAGRI